MGAPVGFVLDPIEEEEQQKFVLDPIEPVNLDAGLSPEVIEQKQQIIEPLKEKSFWSRVFEDFGKAASMNARIGEVRTPEQLQRVQDFGKELLSAATFAQSERIGSLVPPDESDTKVVSELIGTLAPIVAAENVIIKPITKLVRQAGKAGRYLAPLARMAGWGMFGATKKGSEELVKTGELPSAKELVMEGAKWSAFDAALQGVGLAWEFGAAINNIAKETGQTNLQTLRRFFRAVKNKGIDVFKGSIKPDEIIGAVEELRPELPVKPKPIIEVPVKKPVVKPKELPVVAKEKPVVKPLDIAKPKAKPIQPEDITAQQVVQKHLPTKSTPAETVKRAKAEPTELYNPVVFGEANEKLTKVNKLLQKVPKALRPKSALAKKAWEIRQDYYGKRWGLDMRYRLKWNDVLQKGDLSAQDLEDMIFYLEDPKQIGRLRTDKGTGNPFKGLDDTYDALSNRMSPQAKEATKIVKQHFKDVLKTLNESPYVKNISPREFLEQIYVPHFYEGKIKQGLDKVMRQKRFSTKNPLANFRQYITFNDALIEAGLVPKYRNINDLLNHYDALTTRVLTNSELAGEIKNLEESIGSKLIARPNNKALYKQARSEGWVEFADPFLRRRVVGTDKNGKPIFAISEANALVHPDLADALEGIFSKEAYKPENIFLRGMDRYNDQVRALRVQFWPMFHMQALFESLTGAKGLKGFTDLFKQWDTIYSDPEFLEFAAASGLKFGIPTDTAMRDSRVMFESALNKLELAGGKKGLTAKGLRSLFKKSQIGAQFLFGELHPRMKLTTFTDYLAKAERGALKKGIPVTPEWRKKAGREIASIVNDQFGGQAWELMNLFSNPKFLKWGTRAVSYLDWTISALRQLGAIFEDIPQIMRGGGQSFRGKFARKYNLRYLMYITLYSQMMSYLYTGLTNRKDKDGKPIPNSIIWDFDKAHSTFTNPDPKHRGFLSQFFHYQLPDIKLNIAGVEFNPGRDKKNRTRWSHAGKQFLEVPRWFFNFIGQLFNKSTPFIQAIVPYMMDKKPGEGDFKPRGVWKGGKVMPWDGTDPWTWDRAVSRAKFLGEQPIPFFLRSFGKDPGAFPFVFFGAQPISKGISLTASQDFFETYERILFNPNYSREAKRQAEINRQKLVQVLLDQDYTMKQIRRKESAARKKVIEQSKR